MKSDSRYKRKIYFWGLCSEQRECPFPWPPLLPVKCMHSIGLCREVCQGLTLVTNWAHLVIYLTKRPPCSVHCTVQPFFSRIWLLTICLIPWKCDIYFLKSRINFEKIHNHTYSCCKLEIFVGSSFEVILMKPNFRVSQFGWNWYNEYRISIYFLAQKIEGPLVLTRSMSGKINFSASCIMSFFKKSSASLCNLHDRWFTRCTQPKNAINWPTCDLS